MLRQDASGPAAAPVTALAQVPYDIRDFTGREREVAWVRAVLPGDDPDAGTGMALVVIEGMAGTGKTRLAIHVVHQEKHRFELQLHADLRGFSAGGQPADPAAVLEGFLRQLGVPSRELPASMEERATLYRARLDGRRAIILLDDAAGEEQVRPLLPGSPTCGVLVTSRRALAGLDGAQPLPLDVFDPTDALALLARVVGTERASAEPAAAYQIVELCGHLPLAVSLAARRLRSRPAWRLAHLVHRLEVEERRLAELSVSDLAVRVAFDLSYGQLDEPHRRLFRLLALHPGHDVCPYAAAALTGGGVPTVAAMLESLLDEHLLEQSVPGRYRFHDLLHVFARDRLDREEEAAGRARAVRRLLGWYLRGADAANRLLAPHRRSLPYRAEDWPVELPPLGGYDEAMAWCETEHVGLLAAVRLAMEQRHDDVAWQLPIAMFSFFETRRTWLPWLDVLLLGRAAAGRLGDAGGEAWVNNGVGIVYTVLGDLPAARRHYEEALAIRERLGDEPGVAEIFNNLGESYRYAGDLSRAIDYYHRDLEICQRLGDRHGESVSLNNIGKAQHGLGLLGEALASQQEALAASRSTGDPHCEAEILSDLGEIRRSLHDFAGATRDYQRSGTLYDRLGDSVGGLTALVARAELAGVCGDHDEARRLMRQAHQRPDGVEEPVATELRERLARLG